VAKHNDLLRLGCQSYFLVEYSSWNFERSSPEKEIETKYYKYIYNIYV